MESDLYGLGDGWTHLRTPQDIRKAYGIPTDLSDSPLDELNRIHGLLRNLLTAPNSGELPAPLRRFLESEYYRVSQQVTYVEQQKAIQEIRGEVETQVENPELRAELATKLDDLAKTTTELGKQVQDIRASDARAISDLRKADAKWQRRKEFLQVDRAAVVVGAILLLGLATVLTVAMFKGTNIPEILSSAFLLILGFFFGQNSSRGGSSSDSN